MHPVDDRALTELRTSVGGTVLQEGDEEFDDALEKAVWNGDVHRRPALVVEAISARDVATVIAFAREHRLDLTVRGGGHSFAGHAVSEGGLMLDLGPLDRVDVDPRARRARVGGGARWSDLDAAAAAHGLAVTGGFVSHTGVGGLTLGGGMGWLTRRCGLTCDSLVSAQVVTADGRTVTASADSEPDLFWALRGGGGNFGVVTSFEFALHEVDQLANVGLFFWAPQDAREPLRAAARVIPALPREYGAFIGGLTTPPAPFVPVESQGTTAFVVGVIGWGAPHEHAEVVAPIQELSPAFELVTSMPYSALQQMFDDTAPWRIKGYEKALWLDELSDPVIDVVLDFLPRKTSPMSFMPIFAMGGAFADVPDEATAFSGSRRSLWALNIAAIAEDAGMLAVDRDWVQRFWTALQPWAQGAGSYVNFIADDDGARVRASYGEAKYARLAAIKAQWDPDNVFHHNANIRPTPAAQAAATLA